MVRLILSILLILVGIFAPRYMVGRFAPARWWLRWSSFVLSVILLLSTSFINIGQNETGHKHRVYGWSNLQDGAIIATDGEKGPQAGILPPGFQFVPLLNVTHDVSIEEVVVVPEGKYGYLAANDGRPLRSEQTYADAFQPEDAAQMVNDPFYFLGKDESGIIRGQKGPQTSVLTPGTYRLNRFLWSVSFEGATGIENGFVGVIKSNVHSRVDFGNLKAEKPTDCSPTQTTSVDAGTLAVPLVPVGCIGIWNVALTPGKYYINLKAYTVIPVDTRVQAWEYKGGYTRRAINLIVDQKGDIDQKESSAEVPVPEGAADQAVFVKVEGWDVPQELRALVQVTPDNAPFVVASVGGLAEVENRILTPAIRSVVRNIAGGTIRVEMPMLNEKEEPILENGKTKTKTIIRPTRVLDLIENREVLEQNVEEAIQPEGRKAGVDIKEVRFGDPAIPPELLVARQREQLAQQLSKAFTQEHQAQKERITKEAARATADQQNELVKAQIGLESAKLGAQARQKEGEGERDKLLEIAKGQKDQVSVLGQDRVVELRKFELVVDRIMKLFEDHPDILTKAFENAQKFVPDVVVGNGGEGLSGAAAIFGKLMGGERSPK